MRGIPKKPKAKRCLYCGNLFTPNSNVQKYCSEDCYEDSNTKYKKRQIKNICKVCGRIIKGKYRHRYHKGKCANIAHHLKIQEYKLRDHPDKFTPKVRKSLLGEIRRTFYDAEELRRAR